MAASDLSMAVKLSNTAAWWFTQWLAKIINLGFLSTKTYDCVLLNKETKSERESEREREQFREQLQEKLVTCTHPRAHEG